MHTLGALMVYALLETSANEEILDLSVWWNYSWQSAKLRRVVRHTGEGTVVDLTQWAYWLDGFCWICLEFITVALGNAQGLEEPKRTDTACGG